MPLRASWIEAEPGRVTFTFVCRASEVPRSECRVFTVAGYDVLVCEDGGRYFAHSPFCTHLLYSLDWAPVCRGAIVCSWHGFKYDVATGENVEPRRLCPTGDPELSLEIAGLATFPVERRGGDLYVALPDERAQLQTSGWREP
jgi:nitrite reductase/ring-hydroxylating ferredoxin subunit